MLHLYAFYCFFICMLYSDSKFLPSVSPCLFLMYNINATLVQAVFGVDRATRRDAAELEICCLGQKHKKY